MPTGIVIATRTILVVVLGAACCGKLVSRHTFLAFAESLRDLPYFGRQWRKPIARLIVVAEAVSVVCLLVPATDVAGFGLAASLLSLFTLIPAFALVHGVVITCRCFGIRKETIGPAHVLRNAIATLVAISGLIARAVWGAEVLSASESILPIGVGVIGGVLLVMWDDVAYALRPPKAAQRHQR